MGCLQASADHLEGFRLIGLCDGLKLGVDKLGCGGAVLAHGSGDPHAHRVEGPETLQQEGGTQAPAAIFRENTGPAEEMLFRVQIGAEDGGGDAAGAVLDDESGV